MQDFEGVNRSQYISTTKSTTDDIDESITTHFHYRWVIKTPKSSPGRFFNE